jgi:segregation and condensation protein B
MSDELPLDSTDEAQLDAASSAADEGLLPAAELEGEARQGLLTAILFAGTDVLEAERLGNWFGLAPHELEVLVEETAAALRPQGLDIVKAAGGYRLVTAAEWDGYLRGFYRQVRKSRLSKNALEILAVIAYEQPVTRTRIDELRQANSESAVRTLLDRRLITVAGREEGPGRPFLYKTTDACLELFGLTGLEDLPPRPANLDLGAAPSAADLGMEEEGVEEAAD